jgi:cytochrome c556
MSMAHYEAEYDETVLESMAAELGTDMATSLTTNGTLFSATQRALVDRANEAAAARTSLADAIETELNALCDAELELTAIDRRRRRLVHHLAEVEDDEIGAAIDVWHRLNDFETETEKVATERQRSLRNPPMRVNTAVVDTGEMEFYDYLYGATDGPRHPVLAQIVDLTVEIRDDRDYATTLIADSR